MTQDAGETRQGGRAQGMFGPQAAEYAVSRVHVSDASLQELRRLASNPDGDPYPWVVDLGTGAGFTAFAMTEISQRVVATDVTLPMLEQTRRLGRDRGLTNLQLSRNAAEFLPFAGNSVDMVTSRVAGHHFDDLDRALDEVQRVLKVAGALVMADSVSPEDGAVAAWMNDIELRRDFSHVKNRKVSELEAMVAMRGMTIVERRSPRIHLEFNAWVARTATPEDEVQRLRRDFLEAPDAMREAFKIEPVNGDINFSWPCLVFRAIRA